MIQDSAKRNCSGGLQAGELPLHTNRTKGNEWLTN